MKNYENTKWLITGGTSGLGLDLTRMLVGFGAQVAVVARNEVRVNEVVRELGVTGIVGDVSSKNDTYNLSSRHRSLGTHRLSREQCEHVGRHSTPAFT